MVYASSRLLFALALAASRFPHGLAQTGNSTFQWKFGGSLSVSTELEQCQNYSIVVSSLDSNVSDVGVSPYYLIALKADGVPTTSYIGSDPNNLSWQVNHANGSTLVLTVADAVGNAGGEAGSLFTVSGGDSGCLPAVPSGNLTLVANVSTSDPLLTCQPLGLRVFNGQKPYNISIAALDSPVVTNVTMGPDDDVLTWINRANPNGQLIVSVSDANGWGTSTGIFNTAGSTNYSCPGLVTRSGNSADVDQHPTAPSSSSSSHTSTIVAAVVVPICVLVLAGAVVFWRWRRRRREAMAMREAEPAFLPDAWTGPSVPVFSALDGSAGAGAGTSEHAAYSPYDSVGSGARESKFARYRDEVAGGRASGGTGAGAGSQIGMALLSSAHGRSGSGPESGSWSWTGANKNDIPRVLPPGVSREWVIERGGGVGSGLGMGMEPDIIIQHRDGGTVTEIPPPYVDHSAGVGASAGAGTGAGTGFSDSDAGAATEAEVEASSGSGAGSGRPNMHMHRPSDSSTGVGERSLLL